MGMENEKMNIYTKNGDSGFTQLADGRMLPKYDKTLELLGTIDEVNAQIGMAKVCAFDSMKKQLEEVQGDLMKIMAGIADSGKFKYRILESDVKKLECWINHLENSFSREKKFVYYGGCELSARLDVARCVARKAERQYCYVTKGYNADKNAKCYMNRVSDFLYLCARYADAVR